MNFPFEMIAAWAPRLAGALLALGLLILVLGLTDRFLDRVARRFELDLNLTALLARTARIILIILGTLTVFGTLGVNVTALVAGLGLTGFALGFALKDSISNLLSGVLILVYQPFRIGERIRVAGYEGRVLAIDLRYTKLESDGGRILIPNARLFTDPITVFAD